MRLGLRGGGAILLGPVTALGLVTLLRLTAGRVRPPSGHRYCSNSFLRKVKVLDAEGEDGGEQECDERRPRGWRAVTGTRSVGEVVGLSGARDGAPAFGAVLPPLVNSELNADEHVERRMGLPLRCQYPYVDPRILVDLCTNGIFHGQFQQIRTFSKHAVALDRRGAEEEIINQTSLAHSLAR